MSKDRPQTFDERLAETELNILFSYGANDDHVAAAAGLKFIGIARDDKGNEVHVFQRFELPENDNGNIEG